MSVGSPNTSATHVARADCPHLSEPEWEAFQRLSTVIGEAAVATMLRTLSPTEQHGVALGFIVKEQRETAARTSVSPSATPRMESLKLHVSSYVGREGEPLLRWLVEVDTAIAARRIVDPLSKVAFAMSCLGGRARSWAYGRRLTDPTCFSTYKDFKEELKLAFEPPQNEFRSRAEFLDLQQGKHDVHAYAQRARYLVSNIVTNPIDEATKVVTFMKGLRDGPVKTYLFREYPNTLEAAIALAMQEEFSLRQAKLHVNAPRLMPRPVVRPSGGPEPMDLSSATAAGPQQRRGSTNGPAGAGRPTGDAVERVDIGHAAMKIAAPSESQSHCKEQDDKPNLVILKQGWDSLKASPFYKVLREYKDALPDDIPAELPQDKGVQHEIDLVPGTKYCVTRQWPLPREQVKAIDDFFESRRKAGQVRESKSPHSAPTFCVKKPQGGWHIVHAYNKLNDATVPAQTPTPRKDVIIDSMTSSTIFSTLDLRDGFYQILMRESDIPLTAVSTPSGMLWEWLVMPQGLKNAPATFN
uniref:Retrotransposon gag domain-containing protein n=1 Tax=Phytophthora ramorum TaxID=164328 RepID=H3GN03_PHYRM